MEELRAYTPTLRQALGDWIYRSANALGLPAQRMRVEGQSAMDFVPGLGDYLGATEAKQAYDRGDYLGAGIGATATALGLIPGAGDYLGKAVKEAEPAIKKGIRAYHGSPHDFDQFDINKIGTGEGAQAYGHGLYFAEAEDTAKAYREALSRTPDGNRKWVTTYKSGGREISQTSPDWAEADIAATMQQFDIDPSTPDGKRWLASEISARNMTAPRPVSASKVKAILNDGVEKETVSGRMYEVNINASPDDFLDWDQPKMNKQPAAVQEIVRQRLKDMGYLGPNDNGPRQLESALRSWKMEHGGITDTPIQSVLAGRGNITEGGLPADVAKTFNEKGVPGIKYYDQGSRGGGGKKTRNYVVFDDKLISIVKKYGVAGALSAGLISKEVADQLSEEGYT